MFITDRSPRLGTRDYESAPPIVDRERSGARFRSARATGPIHPALAFSIRPLDSNACARRDVTLLIVAEIAFRRAEPDAGDVEGILRIQRANLVDELDGSADEREEGFLSARFSREQLLGMIDDLGIVVARDLDRDRVIGSLCAFDPGFDARAPIVDRMLEACDRAEYDGRRASEYDPFVYDPVCIERSYRGRGLLHGLYDELLGLVAGRYELGVAFVARRNRRSYRAHVDGLGMAPIGRFEQSGDEHVLLAFPVPPA